MSLENKSYAEIADADSFWNDRNDDNWSAKTEPEKSAALIRATEYIEGSYSFIGTKSTSDQVLAWPRKNAYDKEGYLRTGIPAELKNAVSWLANQIGDTEIDPGLDRGGRINRLKADVVEIEFSQSAPTGKTYRHVSRILKNLLSNNASTVNLIRS